MYHFETGKLQHRGKSRCTSPGRFSAPNGNNTSPGGFSDTSWQRTPETQKAHGRLARVFPARIHSARVGTCAPWRGLARVAVLVDADNVPARLAGVAVSAGEAAVSEASTDSDDDAASTSSETDGDGGAPLHQVVARMKALGMTDVLRRSNVALNFAQALRLLGYRVENCTARPPA